MSNEANPRLRLLPEHLSALATFGGARVLSAVICRAGRFDPAGFELHGRLEVLANCGLVEFLARDGKRHVPPGDVAMYYYLTDRGRDLLRWRVGPTAGVLNRSSSPPRYGPAADASPASGRRAAAS
jgi:hypothetical protein